MTYRVEMFDHAWGGWRTGDHESASPGHRSKRAALDLIDTEVTAWPFKRLRLVDEETGRVVATRAGRVCESTHTHSS